MRAECGEALVRAALAAAETQSEHAIFSVREEPSRRRSEHAAAAFRRGRRPADAAERSPPSASKLAALEKQAQEFKDAAERNLRDKLELQELNLRKRFAEELAETRAAAAMEKSDALVGAANDKSQLLLDFNREKASAPEKLEATLSARFEERARGGARGARSGRARRTWRRRRDIDVAAAAEQARAMTARF